MLRKIDKMATINGEIRRTIQKALDEGFRQFIIYPFGEIGMLTKLILENVYDISDGIIIDNQLNQYNEKIKPISALSGIEKAQYALLLASTNVKIYLKLKAVVVQSGFPSTNIFEIGFMANEMRYKVKVGKYSYGPLCYNNLIESVGAFCSFAQGTNVVANHAMQYITTHPMMYEGIKNYAWASKKYEDYKGSDWYFEGVSPRGVAETKRTIIGNDVWLGENVIITNGARIGNGVVGGREASLQKMCLIMRL